MSYRPYLIVAAAVTLAAPAAPAMAAPGPQCAKYANKAVKQQRINEIEGCGYIGPRWHAWWDGHYAWCRGKSFKRISKETKKRNVKLARCRFAQ